MEKTKKILFYYLPPLLWMGIIFYFSSLPDLKSGLPTIWDLILRKIAHMMEFGILVVLILRMFFHVTKKDNLHKLVFLAVVLTILYASTDEFHQAFVPGRVCSLWDLGIDTIGILIGCWIYLKKFQEVKSIKSG